MILASKRKAVIIPMSNGTKKSNLMERKSSLTFFLYSFLNIAAKPYGTIFRSIDFIEKTSYSYIPRIKAIVPPDIPGIISADPMHSPFRKSLNDLI